MVYVTDNTVNVLPTVIDLIKNQNLSFGRSICLQFKNERQVRCYPEPPDKLPCNVTFPYIGVLPESEDIWVKVSKILGRPEAREYQLFIQKTGGSGVNVTFYKE